MLFIIRTGKNARRPDYETFKGLKLGLEAIKTGGSMCTVFNAANEYAVARFLDGEIPFTGIYDVIEACMKAHENISKPSLEQILAVEEATVKYASDFFSKK